MRLSVLPMTTQKAVVFVDAEGKKRKGSRPPTGHLGFVIYHPVFGTVHAHREVPPSLVALLDAIKQRVTYIGQFELLGAIAPFVSMPREWFAGYPGFKSKIFDFAVTTGKKETTPLSFIRVDEASATEEELTMTLTDFRDPNMTISCEVEVVRDNGYGKLRHNKKLGESPIRWPVQSSQSNNSIG